MTKLFIGFAIALVFVGGSTLLSYLYPEFVYLLSLTSCVGGTVGGSLIVFGVLEMRER